MSDHQHGASCTKQGDELAAAFQRVVNARFTEGLCSETFVQALTCFIATQFQHLEMGERIAIITEVWQRTGALCAEIDAGEAATMDILAGLNS